jgi:hypothetical protein
MRMVVWFFALWPTIGAHATPLDDWLSWRLEADAREVEEQLGVDLGEEVTLQRIALTAAVGRPAPGGDACVTVRSVPPWPSVGLTVSGWGGLNPGGSLSLTLTLRGPRRRLLPCVRVRVPLPTDPGPGRARSGHDRLDHTLWLLALARQAALRAPAGDASEPAP